MGGGLRLIAPDRAGIEAGGGPLHVGEALEKEPRSHEQERGAPAAWPAIVIGTANPMPTKNSSSVGLRMPTTMPTTWP